MENPKLGVDTSGLLSFSGNTIIGSFGLYTQKLK